MDPVTIIYELLATAAIVAGGIAWLMNRLDSRFERIAKKVDAVDERTDSLQRQLDIQFGGNGGGIRQALDEHGRDIAFIKGQLGIRQD